MTEEEMAEEYVKENSKVYYHPNGEPIFTREEDMKYAFLAGAEFGYNKAKKEMQAQIEKMKCCMKCEHWYYYKSFCNKDNSYHPEGHSCEHFILRR